jgi:hypothetical protein
MIFGVASLTDAKPRRVVDVAKAVRRLYFGNTNGSSWDLLWGVEVEGCDDFGGGFAFEGLRRLLGGFQFIYSSEMSSSLRQGQVFRLLYQAHLI